MELRKTFLTAVCATAIFFSGESYAEDEQIPCCTCWTQDSIFQIGANYTYAWNKQSSLREVSGSLGGAQAMYEYRPMNCIYAAVKGMWRQGNMSGGGETRYLIDIDAHERLGYTYTTCDRDFWATVFTGIGYRYLGNHIQINDVIMHANYNDFYVPVGFLTDYRIGCGFWIGLNFMWRPQVNATVNLVPYGTAQWLIARRFGNFLVEVPMTYYMGDSDQFSFVFKPFYERWENGHSSGSTSLDVPLDEPAETYQFVGAEFNFGYHF